MTEFKAGDKVKIVENSTGSDNVVGESDLELVTEPKFYDEVVTRKVVLNRDYVTTDLPSGDEFVTSGGSVCVNIVTTRALRNSDIPAVIEHLKQWYDAVQLEKANEPL